MGDKLVFDLSQEVDGSPNVFVKKDWLNILDNMNGNYAGNQSVIDTSQLSNSNKWMSYREGYLYVPMTLSLQKIGTSAADFSLAAKSADYALGLKSWFGQIIHSLTLDYAGTTIIQQTPFINMYSSFKLLTSLSTNELTTLGPTIGFYPDNPLSWSYSSAAGLSGRGVCNNTNYCGIPQVVQGAFNNFESNNGNDGFLNRQTSINYDPDGIPSSGTYAAFLTAANASNLWKSFISLKSATNLTISISAVIYLKHLHSFFQFVPLLKGTYLKFTLNLNNTSMSITTVGSGGDANGLPTSMALTTISVPSGGVNPIMVASAVASNGGTALRGVASATTDAVYQVGLAVGNKPLNTNITSNLTGAVGQNIYLYVPAYSFNPIFESSYLSSPIKSIKYTDVYQYQVFSVPVGGQINQLITNGIANIKSVLIIPLISASFPPVGLAGVPSYQSPFDTAGCGTTAPLTHFTNFNVVISGQNSIYNTQRYGFEEWNNQLYGTNAVNSGEIDGLTSGLISQLGWEMNYCYYYVNVSRMLPVEESVPKSVQIIGQSLSPFPLDLMVFVEYGCSIDVDILSGARVG
jgi:hypothetical protein